MVIQTALPDNEPGTKIESVFPGTGQEAVITQTATKQRKRDTDQNEETKQITTKQPNKQTRQAIGQKAGTPQTATKQPKERHRPKKKKKWS